ncbi:MAG: outer membrane protein assembly factor BamD [Calditrichaeota bacterium]|nr:MAG: outer membrane protein assembly factor BamD [Calditrichota bacterium]MBL1205843.1 outer membrane protein assembly factor BamD [Calditrichota bacterium]NOG45670.1 ABC transporter substrate-binding protein [Calditrichota bacterium]
MNNWKFFFLTIFLVSNLFAQNASTREWTIFQKGVSEYQKGNYDKARQSFSLMINKLPNSALTTANYLMLAKTNYKSGDFEVALQQCEEFKKRFPQSKYVDDIRYLMANSYYRQERIETAVTTWLKAGFSTSNPVLREKVLSLADDVIRYKMNRLSVTALSQQYLGSPINEAFKFHLADDSHRTGNISFAKEGLVDLLNIAKTDYYRNKSQELLDQIEGKASNEIHIAALLPLSGNNEKVGKALLNGFNLAVKEFNNGTSSNKVVIDEFDYASNLLNALEQIKKISNDRQHTFVFGPVENDIVAAVAAIADYEGITIVSPTASSDQIKNVSENCINLAPTVKTMAGVIQSYAYDSLKINRLATFAPIDDYFLNMTEEFVTLYQEKGGVVATQEWYYPGDQNYKKQFRKLKRVGLRLAFKDSLVLDNPEISDKSVDSSYVIYMKEQRELLKETKTKIDSADIPVTTFDGMFVPVFEDDINFIASQFAFSNFQTQLLGNSDWYNKDALKKNRNYVNGIVFVADGYLNEEGWDYRQFRNNFRNTYHETPEKFELIAYDSFKFLSNTFGKTKVSRSNFLEKVVQLKPYQGIYRSFDIDRSRSNKSVRILKYIYGQVIPVK